MILGDGSAQRESHYEILSVKEGASYEEIRSGYRSAILNSHPDKAHNTSDSSAAADDKFLRVQKAWEVLSDSRSRVAYDNELRASRRQQDASVSGDIDLMDVGVVLVEERGGDDVVVELCYDCRCGDCFSVDSSDLERMGYKLSRDRDYVWFEDDEGASRSAASVVVPCGSCSLRVRLSIETGLRVPFAGMPNV
ncbi:unnamed protein product [Linum tenue]|uniref:Uncharacterized protein n=1 Tax=Linum tenue TaxID=586396 RepID=A0AAV0P379_9ROSI|nr:unnamed protein product [Linum tenue]